MEQKLIVIKLNESNDMGCRSTCCYKKSYLLSDLTENAKITVSKSWGQPNPDDANDVVHIVYEMEDISLTDDKMEFSFKGDRYTINRQWQVLGTISFGVPNAYIHVSDRFFFYFATENKDGKDIGKQLRDLYNKMTKNAETGYFWKNIPLARKCLQLMKSCDIKQNEANCIDLCGLVIEKKLLDPLDTPRLILSFMDFAHVLLESDYKWNQEAYRLLTVTWPFTKESDIERFIAEKRHLKYDPIQLSQRWEDNIYEVEEELDEHFKDEPRFMGFCHLYWSAKRAALAKRGIIWRSPREMNPGTMFD